MTPEQQKALALARARRRRADAEGKQSPAMAEGLGKLSAMSADPQAALDAQRAKGRGWFYNIADNIAGFDDGVETTGERIGQGINDVAKASGAGIARGAAGLLGLPGTIGDLIDAGVVRGGQALGVFPDDMATPNSALSSGGLINALGKATGGATDYRGQSLPARFAGTIAEFVPGAAAFGGTGAANILRFAAAPGAASEAAGMATEGTAAEPWARAGAALLAPFAVGAVGNAARRIVSPYGGADPERLKLAQVLDDAGIPMTAGQRVGNEALRRREGVTQGGQDLMETQAEAFTRSALKAIGVDAPRATPDVLRGAAERIGQVFDDVTQGVDVMPTPATVAAAKAADDTYKALAPTTSMSPMVGQVADAVSEAAAKGAVIPAATLRVWRSRLSKLTTSADEATRTAAGEAMAVLDDALGDALTAAGRSDDIARLAEARAQWRDFLAIQKAATAAGEGAQVGLLSPSSLRSAIAVQGRSSYAQGRRGDLGELARAAEGVIKRLPSSGTAENIRAMLGPGSALGGLGAALGSSAGPMGAAAGAVAGAALPAIVGAARMSRPVQAYLANQLMGPSSNLLDPRTLGALLPAGEDMPRNWLSP